MEINILWAKLAVLCLIASFMYGLVRPEFLIGRPNHWVEAVWYRMLAGIVGLTACTVLMTVLLLGAMGVHFLLS